MHEARVFFAERCLNSTCTQPPSQAQCNRHVVTGTNPSLRERLRIAGDMRLDEPTPYGQTGVFVFTREHSSIAFDKEPRAWHEGSCIRAMPDWISWCTTL